MSKSSFCVMTILCLFSSCGFNLAKNAPGDASRNYVHKVSYEGENLALISAWYTGSYKNWPAILKNNPQMSPTKMRIGQVINVPRDLVRQTEPMPKEFLHTPIDLPGKLASTKLAKTSPSSTSLGSFPRTLQKPITKPNGGSDMASKTDSHPSPPAALVVQNEAADPPARTSQPEIVYVCRGPECKKASELPPVPRYYTAVK
jgi:hypothetical protein